MIVAFWYVLWGRGEGRVDGAGLDAGNRGERGN